MRVTNIRVQGGPPSCLGQYSFDVVAGLMLLSYMYVHNLASLQLEELLNGNRLVTLSLGLGLEL